MKFANYLGFLLLAAVFCVVCGRTLTKSQKGGARASCGYESCHAVDETKLNVHLIPHSHDDVGWLKTVDEYYYGSLTSIRAGVQFIISSVIEALQENPDRKFIQVETAFFWQWWKKQSEETRDIVRELVNNGQLEIINAAWSMNDEAAAHYQSIIDQFTWGLRTINDTLGECGRPNIGWQIDPFGHSNEMASIFSQLGYEAVFFTRLDYRDKDRRIQDRALELLWQGSKSLGSSSTVFTHVFSDFYYGPSNFCWDILCSDEPIIEDEESPDYNLEERVTLFADFVESRAAYYQTNNLLVNMGGDFMYQAALKPYLNMDKLIAGFKQFRPDINVIYSTPSCYLKAVNDAANRNNIDFELKTDDFFPYTSGQHSPWTGYFTSRQNSKRNERTANNILQATKQLTSFELAKGKDFSDDITLLREALGIMQHHDAITGTEQQHVTQDYARIVTKAIHRAGSNINTIISDLLRKNESDATSAQLDVTLCLLANVTHCEASQSEKFVIVVYNPLSSVVSDYIRLPTNNAAFNITGPSNESVAYQIIPVIHDFSYVQEINPSQYDLVFKAEMVPALGLQVYYVEAITGGGGEGETKDTEHAKAAEETVYLGTSTSGFAINSQTGLLQSATLNGVTVEIKQEFLYYNGMNGTNSNENLRASGAYIFRPTTTDAMPLIEEAVTYSIARGDLVEEVHQTFNSWIKQVIRVYKDENYIEFDWVVGPVGIMNDLGVEVISRFTTNLNTQSTFYTDSNGRELQKRIRNSRETFEYINDEPVSDNYYPVTARIVLKDEEQDISLAVLNDRAQGGSSLIDGTLELMVHRRLLNDDALGVSEPLNEHEFGQPVVARGQHILVFGKTEESAAIQKSLIHRKLVAPTVFVGQTDVSLENLQTQFNFQFSGVRTHLAENVKILTLEPWKENQFLLRLEHIFEADEHSVHSQQASVNLTNLFRLFDITAIEETTLGANQLLEDVPEKLKWYVQGNDQMSRTPPKRSPKAEDLVIALDPMEIRTFIITYEPRNDDGSDNGDDGGDGDGGDDGGDGGDGDGGDGDGGDGDGGDGDGGDGDGGDGDDGNSSSTNRAAALLVLIAVLRNLM